MECIIGIGTTIVAKLTEYTVASFIKVFRNPSNVDKLRDRIQELKNTKKQLQGRVDEKKRDGHVIVDEAQIWLSEVDGITDEAEAFLNEECQANNRGLFGPRCFSGSFLNLVARRRLSRKAKKMAEDLVRLIEAAGQIDPVSFRPALQKFVEIEGDYKPFESRKKILEGIMDALREPEVSKIGVYGMAGAGKTMLAKEVARQATREKLFSKVAMTTLSQTPDVHKIQQEIAEMIDLRFNGVQSTQERAHRLQCQLKEKKNILIILDDIWKRLDLIEVGIHFEQDQKGCKILLTSRDLDCVRSSMNAEKYFQVEVLSPDEANNLFNKIVGENILVEQPDLQPLAIDIVKECGRLPLAINTVAYALKDKGLPTWNDALRQLQSAAPTNIEEMSEEVYKSIRLSYDFLKNKEEKALLLLCGLHAEDQVIDVEQLMRYCVGWDLFPRIHTLKDARTRVHSLIEKLEARCLLLDYYVYGGACVRMHDVIRDFVISISEDDWKMRCVMFHELKDCMRRPSKLEAISVLRGNNTNLLPERLECPELELLLITTIHSGYIPDNFFVETKKLKAFALGYSPIRSLPQSFFSLQNLQTLCLRNCEYLEDVDFIGDLKNLKILHLSCSSIKQLPRKIGELTNLQLLDLRGCSKLEVIEPNAISNLIRLEELYMAEQFRGWEVEEDGIDERRNVSLVELKNLQQLMVLHLRVPDAKAFPEQKLFSEKLERYRISVGERYPYTPGGISRSLHLSLNQRSQLNALGLELLMKRSEYLWLSGFRGINNFVDDLDKEGFPRLKHLEFYDNDGVQYITMHQIHSSSVFLSLETLELDGLTNLERICQGKFTADSFNKLRKVKVRNCGRLKNLFPLSIVKRLRVIEVDECEMMEEIVTPERESDDHSMSNEAADEVEFSELRRLRLSKLPNYVQFCSCEVEETCGSSSTDSDPKPLFRKKVLFPNLEDLYVSGMNVENLWPEQLPADSYMQNLTSLEIKSCNSLSYLFSFAVTKRLVNLKTLKVVDCLAVEDFLITNREEGIRLENTVLPQLEYLMLKKLPALKRLRPADSCFKFPSSLKVHMESCPKLKPFWMPIQVAIDAEVNMPLSNEKVIFPSLKQLTCFDWPEAVYEIFDMTQSSIMPAFRNLEVLGVSCESHHKPIALSYFKFFQKYPNIETLELRGFFVDRILCQQQPDGGPREQDGTYEHVSTRLKKLELVDAPMLRHLFGDPENTIAFQTLEYLIVKGCSRLQSFALSFMSFQNLKELWVSGCHGLTYLFASSIAATLVQLQQMRIFNCKRMTEIINGDYYTEGPTRESQYNEFVFRRLWHLQIGDLPSLKSFYSGNKVISFPNLEDLYIRRCPEMRIFSHGTVNSSELLNQIWVEGEEFWDSDVNTTVRRIWEDSSNLELEHLFFPETTELSNPNMWPPTCIENDTDICLRTKEVAS